MNDWLKPREGWIGRDKKKAPTPASSRVKKTVIPHPRLRCPHCNSYAVTLTKTDFPVRRYRCDECRESFQTHDSGPK